MMQNHAQFPFHLHTAPFAEGLTVAHFRGREALSKPYAYDLLTLTAAPVALSDLPAVGQPATFSIGRAEEDEEDDPRRIHGVLSRVRLEGAARERDGSWMRIRLVPRLWGLKRRRTRRIFQDQSVTDVVSAILRDWQVPSFSLPAVNSTKYFPSQTISSRPATMTTSGASRRSRASASGALTPARRSKSCSR